ncbi:MAG: hypothetical protein AAGF11_39535 [Myxococcota bacterium]
MPNPRIQSPARFDIDEEIVAEHHRDHRWKVPPYYQAQAASGSRELALVKLTAIAVDGDARPSLYERYRLIGQIRAIRLGRRLPPLAVTPTPDGLCRLDEGFHRFLACVVLGMKAIPVSYATYSLPRYRCA